MKITSITIFFALIAILMVVRLFLNLKNERIGIRSGLIWIFLWSCIGFFALFPSLLDKIMLLTQMESRMFFLLVVAVFILFALIFNLVSRIDSMQRNIASVIREMAIMNKKVEDLLNQKNSRDD